MNQNKVNTSNCVYQGVVQDYGTFDEVISHGSDLSEFLSNEKEENYSKTPPLNKLASIGSDEDNLETPSGEGFIQESTMDQRDVQASDNLSIHATESTQELNTVSGYCYNRKCIVGCHNLMYLYSNLKQFL